MVAARSLARCDAEWRANFGMPLTAIFHQVDEQFANPVVVRGVDD